MLYVPVERLTAIDFLEMLTAQWPVVGKTKEALDSVAETHNVIPLPAFDEDHEHIAPEDYQRKLSGAVVEVHFALMHYLIKQEKKSVFTAVVRQIVVLRAPPAPPVNPLKRARLSDGPMLTGTRKIKKTAKVGLSVVHIFCHSLHQTQE